jgi:hypothetical protein
MYGQNANRATSPVPDGGSFAPATRNYHKKTTPLVKPLSLKSISGQVGLGIWRIKN